MRLRCYFENENTNKNHDYIFSLGASNDLNTFTDTLKLSSNGNV